MRVTKAALQAMADGLGVALDFRIDREGIDHEVVATAPDGMRFADSDVHEMVCNGGDRTPMSALVADMAERLRAGVVPCEEPGCEWCEEARS